MSYNSLLGNKRLQFKVRILIAKFLHISGQEAKEFVSTLHGLDNEQFVSTITTKYIPHSFHPTPIDCKIKTQKGQMKRVLTQLKCEINSEASEPKPKVLQPNSYLDYGCNTTILTAGLAKLLNIDPNNVYGLDISQHDSHIGHRLVYDGANLPYELQGKKFDLITAFQVLHHIADLDIAISNIKSLLSPNGYLLIKEHNCTNDNIRLLIDLEHALYSHKNRSDHGMTVQHYIGRETLVEKLSDCKVISRFYERNDATNVYYMLLQFAE
jgi:2-polyprenyl-3-methyl-5-hydroxy-6-metoxy-1,4-benzoquinol methylase